MTQQRLERGKGHLLAEPALEGHPERPAIVADRQVAVDEMDLAEPVDGAEGRLGPNADRRRARRSVGERRDACVDAVAGEQQIPVVEVRRRIADRPPALFARDHLADELVRASKTTPRVLDATLRDQPADDRAARDDPPSVAEGDLDRLHDDGFEPVPRSEATERLDGAGPLAPEAKVGAFDKGAGSVLPDDRLDERLGRETEKLAIGREEADIVRSRGPQERRPVCGKGEPRRRVGRSKDRGGVRIEGEGDDASATTGSIEDPAGRRDECGVAEVDPVEVPDRDGNWRRTDHGASVADRPASQPGRDGPRRCGAGQGASGRASGVPPRGDLFLLRPRGACRGGMEAG